jgi:outer membrane usher protein
MASRSNKPLRWATCLASALLGPGLAIASQPSDMPANSAPADSANVAVIPEARASNTDANGEDLYLEIVLNGSDTHKIAHFVHSGDAFRISADGLRKLGFRLPAQSESTLDPASLPGVAVHYDEAAQRLEITAPPDLVEQDVAILNARSNQVPQPTASPGLLVNYDLYTARDNHDATNLSLFTELRAFNTWGVFSNTALTRTIDVTGIGTRTDSVRLDTTFSHSFVDQALSLRFGDLISGALDWTRATRLGGIQLQRNFALQPELITFPVPAFYGQASLPSTVDLYINGLKQYSSDVPSGPFQLNTVPVVNGNGQAEVVITDAMGRQRSIAFPFYTTNELLRPGLSDYSLELGFVRENYGLSSFSYASDPAFSGTWRRGLSNWLTIETHGEAVSGLTEGGAGAVIAVGGAGVLNASFAVNNDHGMSGRQAELGYNWRNDRFNFSLDSLRTFGGYRDIASKYSLPPPKRSDRAIAGMILGGAGSIGISYVALEYPGMARSRYASAYYYRLLDSRVAFNFSANQNLDLSSDRSLFLGLSIALHNNVSASLSAQHDRTGNLATLDVSKPVNPDGGLGWHLRAQDGSAQHGGLAEIGYNAQDGQILAGVENFNGNTLGYVDLSGALVVMDRQFFLSRRIDDAFAVVSTDGVANVPVMLENRPIGITNSRGDLLVTPLNAYQRNKLSIDPMKLPVNVDIARVNAEAVPSDRAGTLVRFGIATVHAASVILHGENGKPVPEGSTAILRGASASPAIVGYDGMTYLENLGAHNALDVQTVRGHCTARFDYQPQGPTVPLIGPLVCRETKP